MAVLRSAASSSLRSVAAGSSSRVAVRTSTPRTSSSALRNVQSRQLSTTRAARDQGPVGGSVS